jgi:hypothetical protein
MFLVPASRCVRYLFMGMLRLEDPSDNNGRGWRRLAKAELVDLIYIGLKLARRCHRRDLAERNAVKADAAAKGLAEQIAEKLREYPVFGPAQPSSGHSCGSSPKTSVVVEPGE